MITEVCEGHVYTMEFFSGTPLRRNCHGKTWALVTQCVFRKANLIIAIGEVVKHEKDVHNPIVARTKAAQKALQGKLWKEIRARFYYKILNDIEDGNTQ